MVNTLKKTCFLLGLISLCGCATMYNPATGRNEFILINSATEESIGKNVIPGFLKEHPLSENNDLQLRVVRIGNKVVTASDRQDIQYKFSVLEDKELNAVTLPGGFIYINSGLANLLNDDELAFVLAHETGHVAARHIAKKLQSGMAYQLLLGIAFAGLGDEASAGSQQIVQGADTVYNLVSLSYSRKDEYEADRLAVRYAGRSGFDPYASISALEKIKQNEGPQWKILGYFRTHPYVDERIDSLKKNIPVIIER